MDLFTGLSRIMENFANFLFLFNQETRRLIRTISDSVQENMFE